MTHTLPSYLRSFRKRGALTQAEVGFLVGVSATSISRYEWGSEPMQLKAALACQILFAIPAAELFPGIYQKVEHKVIKRAHTLSKRLAVQSAGPIMARKLDALTRLAARSAAAPPPHDPPKQTSKARPGDRPHRHGLRLRRL